MTDLHLLIYHYTMALNIKDPVTERLASQLAELTSDTKTGAIRTALEERMLRLAERTSRQARAERLQRFLVDEAWPQLPVEIRGHGISKEEREEILGIGAEGV